VFTFNACTTPASFGPPYKISSTNTSIVIGWEEPSDDGGCPITSYAIFRDDGAGGTITTEVNTNNDPAIRGIPTLRQANITYFPIGSEGDTFRFMVTAFNNEGSTDSLSTSIIYAGPPDAPTTGPVVDSTLSDDT
jgi:hypothetical protein